MDFSPHLCYCCRRGFILFYFFLEGGAKIFIDFFWATKFNPEMSRILILVFVKEGYGWYFIELERELNDTKDRIGHCT